MTMIIRQLAALAGCILLVAMVTGTGCARSGERAASGERTASGEPAASDGVLPDAGVAHGPGTPGCGKVPPATPGETAALSMKVGGLEREYRLHLPAGYDRTTPTSLVLNSHGYTDNAANWESLTGMSDHADEHGYVVVYPQATSFKGELEGSMRVVTSWSDLACSVSGGPDGPTCADDADPFGNDIIWDFFVRNARR